MLLYKMRGNNDWGNVKQKTYFKIKLSNKRFRFFKKVDRGL